MPPGCSTLRSVALAALGRLESLLAAVHRTPPAPHAWSALHLVLLEHAATARVALALLRAPEPGPVSPPSGATMAAATDGARSHDHETNEPFDLADAIETAAHLASSAAHARAVAVHVNTPSHATPAAVYGSRAAATRCLADALVRCVAAVAPGGRVDMSCSCAAPDHHGPASAPTVIRLVASPVDPAALDPATFALSDARSHHLLTHPVAHGHPAADGVRHTHMLQLDVTLAVAPTCANGPAPVSATWTLEVAAFAPLLREFPLGVLARSDDADLRRQLAALGPALVPLDDLGSFPRLIAVALPPTALKLFLAAVDRLHHRVPVGVLAITASPAETREAVAVVHGRTRSASPDLALPSLVVVHLAERPLGPRSLLAHLVHLVATLRGAAAPPSPSPSSPTSFSTTPAASEPANPLDRTSSVSSLPPALLFPHQQLSPPVPTLPSSPAASNGAADYFLPGVWVGDLATAARPGVPQGGGGRPSSPRPPPLSFVPGQLPLAFPYSLELEWPRLVHWLEARAADESLDFEEVVDEDEEDARLLALTAHDTPPFRAFVADLAAAAAAQRDANDALVEDELDSSISPPPAGAVLDPALVALDASSACTMPAAAAPLALIGSPRCPLSLLSDPQVVDSVQQQRSPPRSRSGSAKAAAALAAAGVTAAIACPSLQARCRPLPKWQPIMKNLCVLVVDDDPVTSSSLTALLSEWGVAWDLATNADDAFAMATQSTSSSRPADSPYHLIFMSLDLGLGSRAAAAAVSPLDLIRWIRSDEYRRRTSTLMRTRSSTISAAAAAAAAAAAIMDARLRDGHSDRGASADSSDDDSAGVPPAAPATYLARHGTPTLIIGMSSRAPAATPSSGKSTTTPRGSDHIDPPCPAALNAGCNAVCPRPVPRAWAEDKLSETCAILALLNLAHGPVATASANMSASMRFSDTIAPATVPTPVPLPPTLVGRDGVPEAHGAAALVVAAMAGEPAAADGASKSGRGPHARSHHVHVQSNPAAADDEVGDVRRRQHARRRWFAPRQQQQKRRSARRTRSLSPSALVARAI
ncbi:hypothetical protein H9P43_002752 [Blastocladiella emersonii ATCC 22665]|nr:hypothetical protein H9P43_002752 [Blastocladiella emersonii ATCC 22665]